MIDFNETHRNIKNSSTSIMMNNNADDDNKHDHAPTRRIAHTNTDARTTRSRTVPRRTPASSRNDNSDANMNMPRASASASAAVLSANRSTAQDPSDEVAVARALSVRDDEGASGDHGIEQFGRRVRLGQHSAPLPRVDIDKLDMKSEYARNLLKFYQRRLDAVDAERVQTLESLQAWHGDEKTHRRLKMQLIKRKQEVSDLQRALSDAHMFLYDERDHVLRLTAEVEELRIRDMENRKRIQHLLAMTQPVSQEVTYFPGRKPSLITRRYPGTGANTGHAAQLEQQQQLQQQQQASQQNQPTSGTLPSGADPVTVTEGGGHGRWRDARKDPHVVRTVYLPNENVDVLKSVVASLRRQLVDQNKLYQERVRAMQEDRHIREEEAKVNAAKHQAELTELEKEMQEVVKAHRATTLQLLEFRQQRADEQRTTKEMEGIVQSQQKSHRQVMKKVKKASLDAAAKVRQQAEDRTKAFVHRFRAQTISREEDLAILREQYAAAQKMYEQRIRALESERSNWKNKFETLEVRRNLEFEGYTNDIKFVRQRVGELEKLVVRTAAEEFRGRVDDFYAVEEEQQDRPQRQRPRRAAGKAKRSSVKGTRNSTAQRRGNNKENRAESARRRRQQERAELLRIKEIVNQLSQQLGMNTP